jgi:CheY-like chemotaxis protein
MFSCAYLVDIQKQLYKLCRTAKHATFVVGANHCAKDQSLFTPIKRTMSEQLPIVLIVDDEILQLRLVSSLLAKQYCPFPVSSGREALRVLDQLQAAGELPMIQAILLDVMMPEMDGLVLLDLIRNRYPKTIPVILCTAMNLRGTILRAQMLGANDYILKPYDPRVLMEKLAQVTTGPLELGSDLDMANLL